MSSVMRSDRVRGRSSRVSALSPAAIGQLRSLEITGVPHHARSVHALLFRSGSGGRRRYRLTPGPRSAPPSSQVGQSSVHSHSPEPTALARMPKSPSVDAWTLEIGRDVDGVQLGGQVQQRPAGRAQVTSRVRAHDDAARASRFTEVRVHHTFSLPRKRGAVSCSARLQTIQHILKRLRHRDETMSTASLRAEYLVDLAGDRGPQD